MKNQTNRQFRSKRNAKPEEISSILNSAFRKYRLTNKLKHYSVFEHWPDIVGAELAAVAIPEKITRGKILVVKVLDPTWAQELSLRKQEIIAKFRTLESGAVVEDLRCVISNPRDFIPPDKTK